MGIFSFANRKQVQDKAQEIGQLPADLSSLIRNEIQRVASESSKSVTNAGVGVGMFGATAILGWFGFACLVVAAVAGINEGLSTWLSALIVAAALFVIAGVLAIAGQYKIKSATSLPANAKDKVKSDVKNFRTNPQVFRS